MPKIQKEQQVEKVGETKKIYTDAELAALDKVFQKYKKPHALSDTTVVQIIDFDKYHIDQGSMTKNGIVVKQDEFGDMMPIKYEAVEDQIRQWSLWKLRQIKKEKLKIKGLEEIASKMRPSDTDMSLDTDKE